MENCLFCKIIAGEIPATKMYEDENMVIFKDIEPKAKNHFLCVPKSHFKLLAEMNEEQSKMLKACFEKIPQLQKFAPQNALKLDLAQPSITQTETEHAISKTTTNCFQATMALSAEKQDLPKKVGAVLFLRQNTVKPRLLR